MTQDAFASFRDIVSDVLVKSKHDPVRHILVLTYEFDEQQLLNLVCGRSLEDDFELRQKQMLTLSKLRPLVIYDARKTKPHSKLPQFLELHPFKANAYACHHAKAYLIITEMTVRLVLGSFNLTLTGLFRNREVFEDFSWNSESTASIGLLEEWTDFLEQAYGGRLADSAHSAFSAIVATLRRRIDSWGGAANSEHDRHLVVSGYGESRGLDALRKHWDSWFPGTEPISAFAVSPFFDSSPHQRAFASSLAQSFPQLASLTIVTDESATVQLSQAHFGPVRKRKLHVIPKTLSDEERARIERAARQTNTSAKDLHIARALHAKILLLRSDQGCLAYLGSANFTCKAWEGSNQELGLVWKVKDGESLEESLLRNLSVDPTNLAASLPAECPPGTHAEDEEYAGPAHFPEFISGIRLVPADDMSSMHFEIDVVTESRADAWDLLRKYRVQWGGLELRFDEGKSQSILREAFQSRLVGARNLMFIHESNVEEAVWLPYRYDGKLIAERQTFIHPSSLDWLAFYLNPERDWDGESGEFIPGEGGADQDDTHSRELFGAVNREENCVIAMQAYLNLFSRIQRDFRQRLQESVKLLETERRRNRLELDVVQPLAELCGLLERESACSQPASAAKAVSPADVFKLGELSLFVGELMEAGGAANVSNFHPLQQRLQNILRRWHSGTGKQMHDNYIEFVIQQEVFNATPE